jgi:Transglutaminase-like superfamily
VTRARRALAAACIALTLGTGCVRRADSQSRPASTPTTAALPSAGPATSAAAARVRREARASSHASSGTAYLKALALALQKLVSTQIDPLRYGQLENDHRALPTTTEQSLAERAGLCGNQAQAFIDVARRIGLRSRSVEFFYYDLKGTLPESHIAVEARWGRRWHYLDTTTGAFPVRDGNVLSLAELLAAAQPKALLHIDPTNAYVSLARERHNDAFDYLTPPKPASIFVDGSGRLAPPSDAEGALVFPNDVKNAFGVFPSIAGNTARTDIGITVPAGRSHVAIAFSAAAGDGWVMVDDTPVAPFTVTGSPQTLAVPATPGSHVVSIKPTKDVAYMMLTRISFSN